MTYVLLIWLAVGATQTERFKIYDSCTKRLEELRQAYSRSYVIRSSGCFPAGLIADAAKANADNLDR